MVKKLSQYAQTALHQVRRALGYEPCSARAFVTQEIKLAVIADVRRHIGTQKVFDDITLLVLKQ